MTLSGSSLPSMTIPTLPNMPELWYAVLTEAKKELTIKEKRQHKHAMRVSIPCRENATISWTGWDG